MSPEQILLDFKKSLDVSSDFLRTSWGENSSLEFKKSLQTKSEEIDKSYLTIISGLANNKGGMMLFGIENKTSELIGIKPEYENLDNRYFASAIRQGLDGSFDYFFFTGKFLNKIIGFLYVSEANSKPVIIKVNSVDIVKGDIYFRYPAQTARAEAADLRNIIDWEVNRRLTNTLGVMRKIADIGGENVALLNTESGEVDLVTSNQKLIIKPDTLKSINIVKRGVILEEGGDDAYTIKGDIDIDFDENGSFLEKHIPALTKESEIYESFFSGVCDHPEIMLQQLMYHQTQYSPLHFFVKKAGFDIKSAEIFLQDVDDRNVVQATKVKIIDRLRNSNYTKSGAVIESIKHKFSKNESIDDLVEKVKSVLNLTAKNVDQKIVRTICLNTLNDKSSLPPEIYTNHMKIAIDAISHLTPEFIQENKDLVLNEFVYIYQQDRKYDATSILRKVICNVDKALYEVKE